VKPSDVIARMWRGVFPLGDTFGRAELELAAALLVLGCQHYDDTWKPLRPCELREPLETATRGGGFFYQLVRNPFAPKPDFGGLVDLGFCRAVGDDLADPQAPLEFTPKGFEVLSRVASPAEEGPT
jgi:hypothetical protein